MKKQINILTALMVLLISSFTHAQDLYGGIEIGSKGVKITVLDIKNAKKGEFELKDFWTENTAIAKGISTDGILFKEDIEKTTQIVLKNYTKLLTEYKISDSKIFIIASSGVGMAKNVKDLSDAIEKYTKKEVGTITMDMEAKLLVKGGIPANRYLNSFIIDIGGGNTKGGFVGVFNEDNFVFMPLGFNYGTVTLTEKIKKNSSFEDFSAFLNELTAQNDSISTLVKKAYETRPLARVKKNVYFSGGAVWAFATLSQITGADPNFPEFKLQDVKNYQLDLLSNFKKFEDFAKTNKEAERVLKTYQQKYLLAANTILINLLNNLEDPEDKRYYFVKQGQIAWLLAYVVETAKTSKVIY
jgi:exopolyphosphatase/pppGpp-phosphohydrolase